MPMIVLRRVALQGSGRDEQVKAASLVQDMPRRATSHECVVPARRQLDSFSSAPVRQLLEFERNVREIRECHNAL